jgi:nitrogen regulatory protein PII 1
MSGSSGFIKAKVTSWPISRSPKENTGHNVRDFRRNNLKSKSRWSVPRYAMAVCVFDAGRPNPFIEHPDPGARIGEILEVDVFGRGQQRGVQVGNTVYTELPKVMLTIVVEEAKLDAAISAIRASARTGQHGDGKIFISPVDAMYTVRTGQMITE